ncbi:MULTISPECIES: terminase small subunit [Pantoea]|uniref:Terminase small subunit n=1 Tax=Candidatus Pantoea gossypiicola TaxID=2608008 RepID=A0AB34CRE3_9GAMM|nr:MULTISPECIES: terminase small subunit [Pantoea]KAA5961018.1 terminase small subunit [Pantoea sp. VH_24]KAA5964441.1 terminase small subunit [Pantoea sp. VH_16]KAA5968621.1 terminase small subunit [Pantoea sp. VH_18]KAA6004312.1 terminase small subunit [Pantoea sp. M_1]KAA6006796.1 terminase small subunit [Pantoea sp. F_7]
MLTAQKRKFALALISGMSKKDAAIKAGYSANSARSKGSQLAKDPEVIAFIARKKKEKIDVDDVPSLGKKVNTPAVNPPPGSAAKTIIAVGEYDDPLEFLKAVMNDQHEDIDTRKDAAKAMLPYIHSKKGEGGKKDAKLAAAKSVASKFSGLTPPKLVVSNRG